MTLLILHLSVLIRTLQLIALMVCYRRARTPEEKYQIPVNNVNQVTPKKSIGVIKKPELDTIR